MHTGVPKTPMKPLVAVLAIAVVLALVGVVGLATGAADTGVRNKTNAVSTQTTTTTADASADTTSLIVTVPVPTTTVGPTTTVKRTTATTKASTATTRPGAAVCASSPGSGNPGSPKPPAVGTYNYASCSTDDRVSIVVSAAGNSGGVTRRNIETQSQSANVTAHDAFGPSGAVQESATIVVFGSTLQCDWMPDITEYPANLAVGTTWSADSQCDIGNGTKIHATGSRKITGVASFAVAGTTVTAWAIDGTQKLVFTAPNRSPLTFTSTTTNELYDPTRGVAVYEKAVSEASGSSQPPTTTEIRLTSLNPKA